MAGSHASAAAGRPRGRAYCETDVEATDLETVIQDLLDGQYSNPVRVVSFNTAEGWSRDISANVAGELRRRCDLQMRDIPSNILDFIERYEAASPRHGRQVKPMKQEADALSKRERWRVVEGRRWALTSSTAVGRRPGR